MLIKYVHNLLINYAANRNCLSAGRSSRFFFPSLGVRCKHLARSISPSVSTFRPAVKLDSGAFFFFFYKRVTYGVPRAWYYSASNRRITSVIRPKLLLYANQTGDPECKDRRTAVVCTEYGVQRRLLASTLFNNIRAKLWKPGRTVLVEPEGSNSRCSLHTRELRAQNHVT